jgi:GDP-L-fucose synthase
MKIILVTGGSGLVGNYLKKILPDAVYISSKDFDLTDQNQVINMYEKIKPTHVIHLAARVGGIFDNIYHPSEYFEENILMNTFMVKYARKYNVKRFLGVLSSCIFPDVVDQYPMSEDVLHLGPPTKTNFSYGMAKRALSVQIDASNEEYNTKYNYISPCNLYGESDKDEEIKSHFVTSLIKKIYLANRNGDDHITLYGDGTPLRQFMHASDVANIIKIIVDKDITESFNLANKENISITGIAKIALEATNSKHLKIIYDPTKPNGQLRKDLSTEKLNKLIPNYNFITLKEGISDYYKKYKNYHDKISK